MNPAKRKTLSDAGRLLLSRDTILRRWNGPLTADLVQVPGQFGLGNIPARLRPDATATTICGYCSTGCGLDIHMSKGNAVNLSPGSYPVNLGMACPKGWEALTPLSAPDRALSPMIRASSGALEPVSWDTALRTFCGGFKQVQERHGAESVAFLGTGQMVTEELAMLGALAKFGMGMVHGDGNTRQCMATAATAYKESFGFDAPPYTYADFEESDVLVFIGSNPCIAHPIMWQRVLRNLNRPEIIVIDPRRTETAMAATQHYPLAPKSDLRLLYGIIRILIERDWIDREYIDRHTNGFDELKNHVESHSLAATAETTGLEVGNLERLAETIHQGRRVSFWWTMGVNQSHEATRTAQAIINLALITGNIGRPGTGPNSITGQCNAMGSRLFSNTTNLLGGRDFESSTHRQEVADILGMDVKHIPDRNSWSYDRILDGIDSGEIKGLWIVATNPAHSWINQTQLRGRLRKLEFLVVQDMFHTTETAACADLFLAAGGWGEKDGTFINSERRIGPVRKVAPSPGEALSDFNIFRSIAAYWGCGDMFREWTSPEAVFQILKRLSAGRPCDITGIRDYAMLTERGGIQWPFPAGSIEGGAGDSVERRLFEDGRFYLEDGRACLCVGHPVPPSEPADADYPFVLLTGRGSSAQWHTGTRTLKSEVLRKLAPTGPYVELNPADAVRLRIRDGEWVEVGSRRGKARARAHVTSCVQAGQVYMPMHDEATNQLTFPSFDPLSRQPSYKHCAVYVRDLEFTV